MFGSLPLQRPVSVLGGLGTHQTLFLTNGPTANWRFSCVHNEKCGLPGSRHFSAHTSKLGFFLRRGQETTGLSVTRRQRLRSSFYQFLQRQEELEALLRASSVGTSPCKQTNWKPVTDSHQYPNWRACFKCEKMCFSLVFQSYFKMNVGNDYHRSGNWVSPSWLRWLQITLIGLFWQSSCPIASPLPNSFLSALCQMHVWNKSIGIGNSRPIA